MGFGLGIMLDCPRADGARMSETRKLAAILVSDVVGYSRLVGADEDQILARLRALVRNIIFQCLISTI
jgi:class 3 adenylate cyclase